MKELEPIMSNVDRKKEEGEEEEETDGMQESSSRSAGLTNKQSIIISRNTQPSQ